VHSFRIILLFVLIGLFSNVFAQQDVDFHLNAHLLPGKNILKVKRDFKDPYLWVLAQNNEVFRINSLTNVVDDYTSVFSVYSGFQFIDIAGRSKDTVFVATNSSNLIEYKKGFFKLIGTADGIIGTINSIGVDASGSWNGYINNDFTLLLASSNGMYRYNFKTGVLSNPTINAKSRVFEATYRNEAFIDGQYGRNYIDTVEKIGLIALSYYTIFIGELWLGGKSFGHDLKAAYYTKGNAYNNLQFGLYSNQFWATENGLFQNSWNYSYRSDLPYRHYFKGLDIKKITSIYGLLSFGGQYSSALVKENILIGTNKGLYFSNSKYQYLDDGWTSKYAFIHYDALEEKPINDICVNATSYSTNNCEDGVWVAANDGLYLLKPDYTPYINADQQIQAIQFNGQPYNVADLQICTGSSAKAELNQFAYGGNAVQWYKNGVELPAESSKTLTIANSGEYYAVLYDPCSNIHFETNRLKVSVISSPTFTFNYPDKIEQCAGSSIELKADAGNNTYQFRWYKDGSLNGNTTNVQNVTLNGNYKVEVSACQGNWVPSKEVQVAFIDIPQPLITANKPAYCIGDQAQLTINTPVNATYSINWLRNGNILPGNTNQTALIANTPGDYTVIISANNIPCSKTSINYPLAFSYPPTLSIEKHTNTTFCDGETIDLKAIFNTGNITWSTGAGTPTIQVKNSGTYTATVITVAGCVISKDIDVTFFPKPILNMPDATLCEFTNEQITLTAPTGFSSYMWNGQLGGRSYIVKSLGTVRLVVTDHNNCTASETINITSHCNTINMPNTFTPNGDGVNDTWEISGINNDLKTNVTIYNRLGTVVFTSRGYPTPWNGEYQGRKLPMGTYYYIISTGGNKQVLSGSITIIY
jgi:gliding motility-associated-like protein